MLKLRLPKLVALGTFALGVFSTAYADITPLRTGPVSQYGMLMTGINSQNEGRVYGSCNAYSNASGNEVQVKGMSLFWSNEKSQNRFWRNDVITGMVSQQGIQVIRAAMAVDDQGWGNGHYFINGKTEYYQDLLDETVQAAIEQDIYVIIDYHSHTAVDNVGRAKEFFKIQAKKWGSYPNVIFEIYNEPICKAGQGHGNSSNCTMITWPEIKAYANEVIPIIRRYSNNLIVVGTPSWSGNPGAVVGNAITGYDNIAYTFHYYAGKNDGTEAHDFNSMSADVNSALGAGLSVFVTEWGTVGYGGDGAPSMANNPQWQTWMNLKKLSSANWNAGRNMTKDGAENSEYFADFDVDNTSPANWTYSASGEWVNANVFNGLSAMTYSQCASYVDLPAVPADDPDFDDSGDDFGDNIYEDEVISHDYVIDDFDGNNSANEYHYYYESGKEGDWTNGNNGESTFLVDGSNVGGVVGVVTGNNGWAGYGVHVESLKGCETFSYRFRGLAHGFTLGDRVAQSVTESGDWVKMTFDLTDIDPADLDAPFTIQWQVTGPSSGDSLLVDDVQCGDPASSIVAQAYLISDFQGGGRSDWNKYGGYDYVYANEDWSFSNEWLQPSWCKEASCWEYQKTVNDPTQGVVGTALNVVSGENGDAGVGVHTSNLDGCATVQYKYKGLSHKFSVYNFENDATANYVVSDNTMAFASGWTTVTYDMNEAVAKGVDLSKPINVQWEVQAPANGESFYVDDVRCIIDGAPESSSSAEESSSSVSYEDYLVADFENDGEKKSTGDYIYAWGKMGIGNTSCGADCYDYVLTDAANSGTYGAALVGITTDTTQVYGEATIDVMVPNLEGCYTLRYSYKGAAHSLLVRMNNDDDDLRNVNDYPSKSDWKTVYVSMGDNYPLDEITDIRFIVYDQSNYDYLYIDDVECVLQDPPFELPEPKDPTTNTELVDDFEDGDYTPLWTETWGDWTYESVASTLDTIKLVRGNQSSYAIQHNFYLNGMDWDEDEKDSVDIGYDPNASVTMSFDNMNLTHCTEVRYDYKGAAHSFRIKFSWEINNMLDLGWNYHSFSVENRSDSWQTVSIPMGSLRQPYCDEGWGKCVSLDTIMRRASGFDWRVEGPTGMHDSLAIDNIRCVGLDETPYYTVTFKNGDDTLFIDTLAENSNINVPELNPTRASTTQYDYWFTGDWSPELSWWGEPLTDNMTYEAVFDSSLRYYEITFLLDDGSYYDASWEEYGTSIADFAPEAPFKDPTDEYTYSFAGWNPDTTGVTVTGPATFTAVFNETKKQYCITFVDDDNTELKAETCYDYGTLVTDIDVPNVPDKSASEKFAGWNPGLATVTADVVYEAVYTDLSIITWKDYDGYVLHQDYLADGDILDVYSDPDRPSTAEWSYSFTGWTPTVVTQVSGNADYTAIYDSAKVQYYVRFSDDEYNELPESGMYNYGTNVSGIAPTTPTKAPTEEFTYTFTGWYPAFTDQTVVTRDLYYTPIFEASPRFYTVTFTAAAGATVPAAKTVLYGSNIDSLASGFATMPATAAKTFEFVKWTYADGSDIGEFDVLSQDTTLVAVFNEYDRNYMITFLDYNGDPVKAGTLYQYGADIVTPDDPTRDPAGIYTYEFSGWSPLVTQVTQEQVYTATYDSTAHYGAIAISEANGKKTATIDGAFDDPDGVNIPNAIEVDTVIFNRTFSASGYSTITLPFSINRNAIEGVSSVLAFSGIGLDSSGKKQVEMTEVNGELSAYTPYMVELESEGNLVFHGNTMVIQPTEGANTAVRSKDGWEFRGTLSKIVWDGNHPDLGRVYGFSGKETDKVKVGQFVKAAAGAWITPFRAYMIYDPDGNSAGKSTGYAYVGAEPLPDYMDVVVVNRSATGEESKTVIGGLNTRTGEFKMLQNYDLKGRKLNGKPTARGVYYGKKKIIK